MSDKSLAIYTNLPAKTLFGSDESTGNLKEVLEKIREAVLAEPVDVSTPQGRKACASLAYKVARSKTALDEAGKQQTETARAYIARINDERKHASTFLDNLRDEVRKPLNEFEAREKERVDALKGGVAQIECLVGQIAALPNDTGAFASFEQLNIGPVVTRYFETDWAEFSAQAELAYLRLKNAIDAKKEEVKRAVEEKIKAEREAEERQRLAREQAAKEQQEREERLRREERARVEEEAAAKIEKERAEKVAAEENAARIEAQRQADLKRMQEEQERAVQEAAAKAKRDAERKAAQEKAEREAQEKAAQEAEKRRQANREHRASVNNKAAHDLQQEVGLTEEQARAVLVAIVSGNISNVSVNY